VTSVDNSGRFITRSEMDESIKMQVYVNYYAVFGHNCIKLCSKDYDFYKPGLIRISELIFFTARYSKQCSGISAILLTKVKFPSIERQRL